jgi:hypothetical protein
MQIPVHNNHKHYQNERHKQNNLSEIRPRNLGHGVSSKKIAAFHPKPPSAGDNISRTLWEHALLLKTSFATLFLNSILA